MIVLLIAGIGAVLAGLLSILFGIPVKEFSFGNTLILVGAIAVCTGMVLLALWLVVAELKNIARRLGSRAPVAESRARALPPFPGGGGLDAAEPHPDAPGRESPTRNSYPEPVAAAPWQDEETFRDRGRPEAPTEPTAKARRNLLFSSSSRKERERAQARAPERFAHDPQSETPLAETDAAPATFDDAWPKSERARAPDPQPSRQAPRGPSPFAESSELAVAGDDDRPAVTIVKSGVVDGMAYSLYSDGSIEAQMPEGMMRFISIDDLRAHLDQRP